MPRRYARYTTSDWASPSCPCPPSTADTTTTPPAVGLQADVGLGERAVEALDQIVGELRRDAGPQRELLRLRRRGPRRAGGGTARSAAAAKQCPDDGGIGNGMTSWSRSLFPRDEARIIRATLRHFGCRRAAMTIDDKCGGCSPRAAAHNARRCGFRRGFRPEQREQSCGRWRSGRHSSRGADRSGSHRAAAQAPAGGGGAGRRRPDGHPGTGAEGPFDRHSQGEAGAVPEGHGCEEAPDASHDRGRQVQREHPAHHRRGNRAGAPDHRRPVGRARRRRDADDRRRAREGQDSRRSEPRRSRWATSSTSRRACRTA